MYGFSIELNASFHAVLDRVTEELKEEGFGILTTIDVQKTLKEKLNVAHSPYLILGACNPGLAHQALQEDENIGLLLPCNVVIRENANKKIIVSFLDPLIISQLAKKPNVKNIAEEARKRLERVRDRLKTLN